MNASISKTIATAAHRVIDVVTGSAPAVEAQAVPAIPTAAENKARRAADKLRRADDKAAAQAARINADVAQQIAAAKPTLTPAQTEVMAKALDIPAEDVAKHVEIKQAPPIPTTGYQGPMLALRDRIKRGVYAKAANGQPSCGDEVATILGTLEPVEVIKACLVAMDTTNPYTHLNVGQQSMNLRNKLRGMLKRGEIGMGVVREAVEVVIEGRPPKKAMTAEQMNKAEAKMDKEITKASETVDMEPTKTPAKKTRVAKAKK